MENEARVPEEVKIKKACEILQALGIDSEMIDSIKNTKQIHFTSGGFFRNFKLISKKFKELIKNNNFVYSIIPGIGEFERTVSILYIPDFEEDFEYLFTDFENGTYRVFAYVLNFDNLEYSESGSVLLSRTFDNRLVRIG